MLLQEQLLSSIVRIVLVARSDFLPFLPLPLNVTLFGKTLTRVARVMRLLKIENHRA